MIKWLAYWFHMAKCKLAKKLIPYVDLGEFLTLRKVDISSKLEAANIADKNISLGQCFIVGSSFYLCNIEAKEPISIYGGTCIMENCIHTTESTKPKEEQHV